MPLVLESEGPRLEGVEGEVSELRGEEKPSWGRSTLGQPARPRVCWPKREGALGSSLWVPPPGLWDTVGARRPTVGCWVGTQTPMLEGLEVTQGELSFRMWEEGGSCQLLAL